MHTSLNEIVNCISYHQIISDMIWSLIKYWRNGFESESLNHSKSFHSFQFCKYSTGQGLQSCVWGCSNADTADSTDQNRVVQTCVTLNFNLGKWVIIAAGSSWWPVYKQTSEESMSSEHGWIINDIIVIAINLWIIGWDKEGREIGRCLFLLMLWLHDVDWQEHFWLMY